MAKPQVHIHRFGSSLNGHVHFHVCAVDGVFEEVAGGADAQSSAPGIAFHPASAIDAAAVAQVQTDLRRRIRRAFVGRGLLQSCDAKEMLGYPHSGFSVDAGGAHRSRRPRSPVAAAALPPPVPAHPSPWTACAKKVLSWCTAARNNTASLVLTPVCGGQMRLIAFITEGTQIRRILDHIGVDSEPLHVSPARGSPLGDDCDAQTDDGVHIEPHWDLAAQPAPGYEVDQRVNR